MVYAVREYACSAVDVLARRLRLGFLNTYAAAEALPKVIEIMGKELNWSKAERQVCCILFRDVVDLISSFNRLKRKVSETTPLCDRAPLRIVRSFLIGMYYED